MRKNKKSVHILRISSLTVVALTVGAPSCFGLGASDNQYTGPVGGDWNTAGNWSRGFAPPATINSSVAAGGHVFVNDGLTVDVNGNRDAWAVHVGAETTAGTIIINSGANFRPRYLRMGRGEGVNYGPSAGNGTVVMNGNSFTTLTEFYLGFSGGGNHNFIQNSGTVTVGGSAIVGGSAAGSLQGSGTVTLNGGTMNRSGNMFFGNEAGGNGVLNVNGGATFNQTSATLVIAQRGDGTLNLSGGTLNVGSMNTANYEGDAVVNISGGVLDVNSLRMSVRGTTTMDVSSGTIDANELRFGWTSNVSTSGAQLATVNQTGGTVRAVSMQLSQFTTDGTYNLQGGTLASDSIGIHTGATFNWGEGILTTATDGAAGATGEVSSPGFNTVLSGTTLNVSGANADLATGHNFGSGATASTLDLGGLFINSGVRFNQLAVDGSLDLSAAGDTLAMDINPYLLRPNIGLAIETGAIPLITATGGITDEFDIGPNFLQDNLGWQEFGGTWITGTSTAAATLGKNEYYLDYSSGALTLYYKVEGTVPEPGTMGLAAFGLLLMRGLRDRRRRSHR